MLEWNCLEASQVFESKQNIYICEMYVVLCTVIERSRHISIPETKKNIYIYNKPPTKLLIEDTTYAVILRCIF